MAKPIPPRPFQFYSLNQVLPIRFASMHPISSEIPNQGFLHIQSYTTYFESWDYAQMKYLPHKSVQQAVVKVQDFGTQAYHHVFLFLALRIPLSCLHE